MIITFCGHSAFRGTEEYEQKILDLLKEKVGDSAADMYLGGYGGFDRFAYGLFDFSALLYYISISGVFLFLTVRVYEKRRWG